MLSIVVDNCEQALRNLGAVDQATAEKLLSTMDFTPPLSWSERRQLLARFVRISMGQKRT